MPVADFSKKEEVPRCDTCMVSDVINIGEDPPLWACANCIKKYYTCTVCGGIVLPGEAKDIGSENDYLPACQRCVEEKQAKNR